MTDHVHDEVEDGAVSTTFKNKAYDTRVELQHEPIAGFKGVIGLRPRSASSSAEGEEAYVQPTVTRKAGLLASESQGDWRFYGLPRPPDGRGQTRPTLHTAPVHRWRVALHAGLMGTRSPAPTSPSAEELYARAVPWPPGPTSGVTLTCAETSQNIDAEA